MSDLGADSSVSHCLLKSNWQYLIDIIFSIFCLQLEQKVEKLEEENKKMQQLLKLSKAA